MPFKSQRKDIASNKERVENLISSTLLPWHASLPRICNFKTSAVIAALLHDLVEDTEYKIDFVERSLTDVAYLVKVVTKQKKEHYEFTKQVDNFKQMLDSVNYDIRALLVKLADRLHNMRTLASMKPEKQLKIAGETDFFYGPLANRLGFYWIKTELENLSFQYRCPQEYSHLQEMLEKDKSNNESSLSTFTSEIKQLLNENQFEAKIEVKYRMPYSIWRKMVKEKLTSNTYRIVIMSRLSSLTVKSERKRTHASICIRF